MVDTIHRIPGVMAASKGARRVSFDEMALVPIPASTNTWFPVPYAKLVRVAKEILGNQLPGDYELVDEAFILAQEGNQMFGALTYKSARMEIPFAMGVRGSYNKTLREAVAFGGKVTVCSNLTFTGLIQVVRKNTKNALRDIQEMLAATVKTAATEHLKLIQDITTLYNHKCDDRTAFEVMGLAWGREIIGTHQLSVTKQEWLDSSFQEFKKRNWWSLYNAFTYAMKTTPPGEMMANLSHLHRLFME